MVGTTRKNIRTHGKKRQALEFLQANRLPEARDAYTEICRIDQRDAEAWFLLGAVNGKLNRIDDVIECCIKAVALKPGYAEAHFNLALGYMHQNRRDDAIASFSDAVRHKPDYVEAYMNLGSLLGAQGQLDAAIASYQKVLQLQPNNLQAYNGIGFMLYEMSKHEEAKACWQHALKIDPHYTFAHSNLLLLLNYRDAQIDPSSALAEHQRWAALQTAWIPITAHRQSRSSNLDRRLKVGYVSPDLCAHSVAFFFEPLLAHHDPATVEAYCYANVEHPDNITAHFRALAPHWRDIHRLTDAQVAAQIQQDGIDILVDLAGHTAKNRLLVFARKPAPIQVTYLGYPNTTGLATMDYRFTDALADPPGQTERLHTERLVRLPRGFLCFRAPDDAPPVTPPPCLRAGHVTFGSFNNLAKVTPEIIACWARLLTQVPGSRLILKNKSLRDPGAVTRLREQFARHGIAPGCLELVGYLPRVEDHLAFYGQIDIALDTFPYHGTTTTCQALWMGVPVITLAGATHASRVGVSLLTRVGLPEFISDNDGDYIKLAVALANDPERLTRLRQTLRTQMQTSPLCDGQGFARDVEAAYREMWRGWCGNDGNKFS